MNWETDTVTGPSQSRMGSWSGTMPQRAHTQQMVQDPRGWDTERGQVSQLMTFSSITSTTGTTKPGMDATSSSSSRPATTSISYFSPNITEGDFNCTWGGGGGGGHIAQVGVVADVEEEENPLFWTFPMQRRPILPTGKALREAGFEIA